MFSPSTLLLTLVALFLSLPTWAHCAAGERPNFVVILADDLGWKDAGFLGSGYYETPRLDGLAAQSTLFRRAYGCPSCAPTRAALLSGQYSPRHGVFMVGKSDKGNRSLQRLVPIPNREDLPLETVTVAETLSAAGYATALIGKWHLGNGSTGPEKQGFQTNIAGFDEGTPPSYFSPYKNPTLPDGPEGEYLTDRLTNEAIRFIDENKERPFFLYLSQYAVHVPLQAKPKMEGKYRSKPPDGEHKNPTYAAMVESLDESVGRVLDQIDRLGLADKTYVVFLSDNGGQMGITAQPPLREGKGWLYEGGVRVPMLIRAPKHPHPGAKCDTPVHVVDLYPTLLQWAGLKVAKDQSLDGVSLDPLLANPGAKLDRDALFWHFPGYQPLGQGFRIRPSGMIIGGKWKLIESFEDGQFELYDLEADIGEARNAAGEQTAVVARLKERLVAWRKSLSAPIPTRANPDYRSQLDNQALSVPAP